YVSMNGTEPDSSYDETYSKVWKISKAEIEQHRQTYFLNNYIMPWAIEHWPAHGDTSRGEAFQLAPFADNNGNGIYEPHLGEYPLIVGDEAVFFMMNDARYPLRNSSGVPLNIEVHGMLYAFEGDNNKDLNNTLFLNYKIINRNS